MAIVCASWSIPVWMWTKPYPLQPSNETVFALSMNPLRFPLRFARFLLPTPSDEPFNPAASDKEAQTANQQSGTLAAKAFHEATSDRASRGSFLARGCPDPSSFQVGSYVYNVYYIRAQTPDNKGGKLTLAGRRRGPARSGKQDVIWSPVGPALLPNNFVPNCSPARLPFRSWIRRGLLCDRRAVRGPVRLNLHLSLTHYRQ